MKTVGQSIIKMNYKISMNSILNKLNKMKSKLEEIKPIIGEEVYNRKIETIDKFSKEVKGTVSSIIDDAIADSEAIKYFGKDVKKFMEDEIKINIDILKKADVITPIDLSIAPIMKGRCKLINNNKLLQEINNLINKKLDKQYYGNEILSYINVPYQIIADIQETSNKITNTLLELSNVQENIIDHILHRIEE